MHSACRRTLFVLCVIKCSSAVPYPRGQLVSDFLFSATAAGRQIVDRECTWKPLPIVERMNSEGSPGGGARYFEVKQPLVDVTWSSKEGRRADRHADQHSPP
ncbi:hypothetical protein CEXT_242441 [Caerostris extrusa]|uniref:Secreted protein n=1 Tax=Caerostris extrusa TaxID=172846 RepID=A0AAV4VCW5_CAEEX|nr:hypothetical protein CEXT_242441 [Caerostris extrusa]